MTHYLIKDDIIIYLHFWPLQNMVGVVHICMPAQDPLPINLETVRRQLADLRCLELIAVFRPLNFSTGYSSYKVTFTDSKLV